MDRSVRSRLLAALQEILARDSLRERAPDASRPGPGKQRPCWQPSTLSAELVFPDSPRANSANSANSSNSNNSNSLAPWLQERQYADSANSFCVGLQRSRQAAIFPKRENEANGRKPGKFNLLLPPAGSITENNMIMTATETLATGRGRAFGAYLARPASGQGPGLMVLTEMFGVNGPMREVAESYARRGFAALVPNLFWRSENTGALAYEGPDRDIAWARLKAFDVDAAADDMRTAVAWLRGQPFCTGKVAALGFCAGGRMAFLAAARAGVDGAVSLYGLGIARHVDEFGAVRCPVQLHYGLQDPHVPQQEIDTVARAAQGHPSIELHLYPDAGHSFANPVRPTYDAAAAQLAASRIDRLLGEMQAAVLVR